MRCPHCGRDIGNFSYCPHCYPQAQNQSQPADPRRSRPRQAQQQQQWPAQQQQQAQQQQAQQQQAQRQQQWPAQQQQAPHQQQQQWPAQQQPAAQRPRRQPSAAQQPPENLHWTMDEQVLTSSPASGARDYEGGSQASIHTRIVSTDDMERDRHTRIVDVSVPKVVKKAAQEQSAPTANKSTTEETDGDGIPQIGTQLKALYRRMHRVDRGASWIGLMGFVAAFLPWRWELGRGMVSGIEGLGVVSAAGGFLFLLCIAQRVQRRRLSGLFYLGQLFGAFLTSAAPLFILLRQAQLAHLPGLYLAGAGGAMMLVMTFLRMALRAR